MKRLRPLRGISGKMRIMFSAGGFGSRWIESATDILRYRAFDVHVRNEIPLH